MELTRSEAGDTRSEPGDDTPARPPSREAPEASAAAPTAGGGSGGNVEEAPQPRAPAAAVVYGPLELRRQEGREDTSCWQALHPSTFQVRGANYMRDGKKVPSDEGSSLLAVELFEARDTVYNVAVRRRRPAHPLPRHPAARPARGGGPTVRRRPTVALAWAGLGHGPRRGVG